MFVKCRKLLLVLFVLLQTESSTEDVYFIEQNVLQLIRAVQKTNKNIAMYLKSTGNCTMSFNHSLPEMNKLKGNHKVDVIIDKYLKEVNSWKMFKNIDKVVHIL